MKKQKKRYLVVAILCSVILIGGPSLLSAYTGEGQKALILKIGSEIPGNDPVSQAPMLFAERMTKRSNGKIQITYFPESQLGKWQQMLESVKAGSLAMAFTPAGGSKEFYVIQLPFLFRDLDHATKVMDGEIREGWAQKHLEKTGIYIFGWQFGGWQSMFFSKIPVRTPVDMKGMKFRVPQDKIFIETFEAIGARPTPIPFGELYLALRQGVADGLTVPTQPVVALKFWEVVKYGTLTHHMISAFLIHLNGDIWKSLTPESKKLWMDTWKEVTAEVNKLIMDKEREDVALLKSKGMVFTEPNIEAFRDATKNVWKKMLTEPAELEAYEKIKATR
jgi:tripartite ATP-independent transporter DctP family solute receptor